MSAEAPRKKWEYTEYVTGIGPWNTLDEALAAFGAEGWEAWDLRRDSFTDGSNRWVIRFKREVTQ